MRPFISSPSHLEEANISMMFIERFRKIPYISPLEGVEPTMERLPRTLCLFPGERQNETNAETSAARLLTLPGRASRTAAITLNTVFPIIFTTPNRIFP
jgi:hypothetical protein